MYRRFLSAITLLIAAHAQNASAQDVEMLGRRYGTRPPDAYYREIARNPNAFRFTRGRAAQMRRAAALRGQAAVGGPAGVGASGPAAAGLGPRSEAVVGDIHVPVLLGLFSGSPPTPPVSRTEIQDGYFGPQTGTVADYYAEISNDSIALIGEVQDWVTSSMTQAEATENVSGLACCGIGDYIRTLLDSLQVGVDWGAYDNDGPDGVPNSGDDDGYVDVLAVIHPTAGAECSGDHPDRIWSHKWTISAASSGGAYVTSTVSNAPGVPFVLVEDYFVQGAVRCSGTGLNEIGVFTHELGHAFGLPDLYDTRSFGFHNGAGEWDLMASGTWGCTGSTPQSPCHMGAWSKAMLGWVTVDTLPPDTDLGTVTLPPVETTGLVYRVDAADGSDEYFLLENRQSVAGATYDQGLPAEGLLIWQVDAGAVDARWVGNTVNSDDHMGVWLRQADGLDQLGMPGGNRGDAGDPFPGSTMNTDFHAATNPAARSYEGTATGLSVLDIASAGDEMTFHLLTRFASMPDQVVDLVATVPDSVQLTVQDGTPPISWAAVGGGLPEGITLRFDGRIVGASVELGLFPVPVEATDALGLTATATVTLSITAPVFPIADLTAPFLLSAEPIDSIRAVFLDRQGNDDGSYDLGDFRAWLLAHPNLPLSAAIAVRGGGRTHEGRSIELPLEFGRPEEAR